MLTYSQNWLHNKSSFETVLVSVRDFPADDLVLAKYESPAFEWLQTTSQQRRWDHCFNPNLQSGLHRFLESAARYSAAVCVPRKNHLTHRIRGALGHLLAIDYTPTNLFRRSSVQATFVAGLLGGPTVSG